MGEGAIKRRPGFKGAVKRRLFEGYRTPISSRMKQILSSVEKRGLRPEELKLLASAAKALTELRTPVLAA